MPEGDTIFRTAMTLRSAIETSTVTVAEARDLRQDVEALVGQQLLSIEARGKHLLMHFEQGEALHSHMGMTGAWHLYHAGEPWKKPQRRAAITLHFDQTIAVCFSPKLLELLTKTAYRRHEYLRRLGPDILATELAAAVILARFRIHNATPLGEAVMNQTIACGVGNVYKSEVLFLNQLNPFRPTRVFSDDQVVKFVTDARRLMKRNLSGYPRRTRFAGDAMRLWVYDRRGEPCFDCGTQIQMRRQGDLGRSTYWCPSCQASH